MSQPLVSIIICCYNGERFLGEAFQSILSQDYDNLEIVFIDDGSTDGSAAIAKSQGPKVSYFHQENKGLPAARNAGVNAAKGELIGFLDCDDIFHPGKLQLQVDLLRDHPDSGVVVGKFIKSALVSEQDGKPVFKQVQPPSPSLNLGCALIRREIFKNVAMFDETQSWCDDWDWFFRIREAGVHVIMQDEVTTEYRRHDENMTNDEETGNAFMLQMLRKTLQRRREQQGTARDLPSLLDKED